MKRNNNIETLVCGLIEFFIKQKNKQHDFNALTEYYHL